jgi:hypothetical protein
MPFIEWVRDGILGRRRVVEVNAQERQVPQSIVLADPGAERLDIVGVGKA